MNNNIFTPKLSKKYKKDVKALEKDTSGKYDLSKLDEVLKILIDGQTLPEKYNDHKLVGKFEKNNDRECHLGPDWVLRYRLDKQKRILHLLSTGDHRRVLGIEAFDMTKNYYGLNIWIIV